MKLKVKILSILMAIFLLLSALVSCGKKAERIAVFDNEDYMPVYAEKYNTEYAYILRNTDTAATRIEIGNFKEQRKIIYESQNPYYILELVTDGKLIAFFELCAYSDGSIGYTLKYYDSATEKVKTIYSKTISDDNDAQTRSIALYDGKIYYLTASLALSQSRIMVYDTSENVLSEYLTFPFTNNSATKNHASTFISQRENALCVSYVEKNKQFVRIYDLKSGQMTAEKRLPDSVKTVYYADYDQDTDLYALYYAYSDSNNTSGYAIGYLFGTQDSITVAASIPENTYISHEKITLCNNLIYYNTETNVDENTIEALGILHNIQDSSSLTYDNSIHLYIDGNSIYNVLYQAHKKGGGKVEITKSEIVSKA